MQRNPQTVPWTFDAVLLFAGMCSARFADVPYCVRLGHKATEAALAAKHTAVMVGDVFSAFDALEVEGK